MNIKYLARELVKKTQAGVHSPAQVAKTALDLLTKHRLSALLPALQKEIESYISFYDRNQDTIVTAAEIEPTVVQSLIEKYQLSKDVKHSIKPEIIGGYQIVTKDKMVDSSVQEQLVQLRHHLLYHE